MSLANCFTAHPASVDETYLEHAKCASGYAKELFLAACAAAIHAVFPALFETTASEKITAMSASIHARHAADARADSAPELVAVS